MLCVLEFCLNSLEHRDTVHVNNLNYIISKTVYTKYSTCVTWWISLCWDGMPTIYSNKNNTVGILHWELTKYMCHLYFI